MDIQIKLLLEFAKIQERLLLNMRDTLIRYDKIPDSNPSYNFERAKFIGYIDIMRDVFKLDVSEFNWVYLV